MYKGKKWEEPFMVLIMIKIEPFLVSYYYFPLDFFPSF